MFRITDGSMGPTNFSHKNQPFMGQSHGSYMGNDNLRFRWPGRALNRTKPPERVVKLDRPEAVPAIGS